jgi:hypothetical protein
MGFSGISGRRNGLFRALRGAKSSDPARGGRARNRAGALSARAAGCLAPGNRRLRLPGLAIGCRQNHPSTILLIRRAKVVFVFRQMISFSNAKSLHAAFDETASI